MRKRGNVAHRDGVYLGLSISIYMKRLSEKVPKDNKTMEQISEDLDRRMAKYDTPENKDFMQTQVWEAILSLVQLFSFEDKELGRIVMPEFAFCDVADDYSVKLNEIWMDPEGITPYRIGSVAAEFLYYTINPEIFHQQDKFSLAFTRWDFPYNPVYSCPATPLSLIFTRIPNLS